MTVVEDVERPWQPGNRAQWTAVVVTLVIPAILAIGLPRLADATAPQDTEIAAGERVEQGGVSVEVPAGWVRKAGAVVLAVLIITARFALSPSRMTTEPPAD
jgi:hypothetical protein